FYPGELRNQVRPLFKEFEKGQVVNYEMALMTKTADKRVISWNSVNRFGDDGKIEEIIGIGIDVTERKRAERLLAVQYSIVKILTESSGLTEASPKIIDTMLENLEWDLGAVWRVDKEANLIKCIGCRSIPSLKDSEFVSITSQMGFMKGTGMPGNIWATGK